MAKFLIDVNLPYYFSLWNNDDYLLQEPPKVIRIGNVKMKEFFDLITQVWPQVLELNETRKIVNVFRDRVEAIT